MTSAVHLPRTFALPCATSGSPGPLPGTPFHRWRLPDGSDWLHFHRIPDGYLLRFPELADFTVSTGGEVSGMQVCDEVPAATIEHIFLNQVLPLARSRRGDLVLHAAAVEFDSQAVVFVGPSGAGKSTLTAALATHGLRFLADDGVAIQEVAGQLRVLPGHASIRLWTDTRDYLLASRSGSPATADAGHKLRVVADEALRHCNLSLPFAALYLLGPGTASRPQIHAASAAQLVQAVLGNCFLLDVEARDLLEAQFALLGRLQEEGGVYCLDYPRNFDCLDALLTCLVEHVRSRNSRGT